MGKINLKRLKKFIAESDKLLKEIKYYNSNDVDNSLYEDYLINKRKELIKLYYKLIHGHNVEYIGD